MKNKKFKYDSSVVDRAIEVSKKDESLNEIMKVLVLK